MSLSVQTNVASNRATFEGAVRGLRIVVNGLRAWILPAGICRRRHLDLVARRQCYGFATAFAPNCYSAEDVRAGTIAFVEDHDALASVGSQEG